MTNAFKRMFAVFLILITVIVPICFCDNGLGSAYASGNISVEEDVGSVALQELFNSIDQSYPSDVLFDSDVSAVILCEEVYKRNSLEYAQKIYYGTPAEAATILKQIQSVLYTGDHFSEEQFTNDAIFYVVIWTILHGDYDKSRPSIKEFLIETFADVWSEESIISAVDLCVDYIEEKEPELKNAGINMTYNDPRYTYADDEYIENFQTGYQLFEEGKYKEAIKYYEKCLGYDVEGFLVEFEIVEAYIQLRDYQNAEKYLSSIAPKLTQNNDKAKWLRRYGFIAIEQRKYELAYALYVYSLAFEDNSSAYGEIEYIEQIAPKTKKFTVYEAETYLKKLGISFTKE